MHLAGQDDAVKDILGSAVYAARTSLTLGFIAPSLIVALGTVVDMLAGNARSRLDMILMAITNPVLAVPSLPLMLVIIAVAGPGSLNIISVPGILSWTCRVRIVRPGALP